jgi:hypothetical protein
LADFNNNQLVTIKLLRENEVQSDSDGNVQIVKSSTPVQVTLPLNFLQITTRSNSLNSALNTNVIVNIVQSLGLPIVDMYATCYSSTGAFTPTTYPGLPCYMVTATTPAGFYSLLPYISANNHQYWPYYPVSFVPSPSATVNGFFGGCTSLDALLASTLDCLYDITCLQIFVDYFPGLNQVYIR